MEIKSSVLDRVIAHCHRDHPIEACGVLAGPRDGAGPTHWWPMDNVAEHPRYRYAMSEDEQLHVWRAIDGLGHRVFAIYHSHTVDSDRGELSPEDLRHALDPDIMHLVVRVTTIGRTTEGNTWHGAQCRLWKVVDGTGVEQPLTVAEL